MKSIQNAPSGSSHRFLILAHEEVVDCSVISEEVDGFEQLSQTALEPISPCLTNLRIKR
jgi:hypothetical protein